MAIVVFFVVHWQLSIFLQSFFQHRYAAHRQFKMSKGWERFFHFMTWLVQGSSFLRPSAYAIMHRMHHAYSDTEKDPHSPMHQRRFFKMIDRMWLFYSGFKTGRLKVDQRFLGSMPEWELVDRWGASWPVSLAFVAAYTFFYVTFATEWWMYLLIPVHCWTGPIHGSIVNWFGHKHGYRNFASDDASRNTLPFDFLTAGELLQNNHHKFGQSPNFAARWFELDTTYQVIRVLGWLGIVDLCRTQTMRFDERVRGAQVTASQASEGR